MLPIGGADPLDDQRGVDHIAVHVDPGGPGEAQRGQLAAGALRQVGDLDEAEYLARWPDELEVYVVFALDADADEARVVGIERIDASPLAESGEELPVVVKGWHGVLPFV